MDRPGISAAVISVHREFYKQDTIVHYAEVVCFRFKFFNIIFSNGLFSSSKLKIALLQLLNSKIMIIR